MPNLERLKVLSDRLSAIASDPQPGLYAWQMSLLKVLEELTDWMTTQNAHPQ